MITTRAARRFTASALATLGAAGLGASLDQPGPAPQAPSRAPQATSLDVCEYLSKTDAIRACKGAPTLKPTPGHIAHMACVRREIELRCKLADARMRNLVRNLQKESHK